MFLVWNVNICWFFLVPIQLSDESNYTFRCFLKAGVWRQNQTLLLKCPPICPQTSLWEPPRFLFFRGLNHFWMQSNTNNRICSLENINVGLTWSSAGRAGGPWWSLDLKGKRKPTWPLFAACCPPFSPSSPVTSAEHLAVLFWCSLLLLKEHEDLWGPLSSPL